MSAAETALARDGKALMPIVVPAHPSPELQTAIDDLVATLREVTGAEFAVTQGDGATGIVVGSIADFPVADLQADLVAQPDGRGRESLALRSEADRLLVLGATDRGAVHAVYMLLREIGCRWFFPSAAWTVMPKRPTLAVDLDRRTTPALLFRRIWYGFGMLDQRCTDETAAWSRRNRMGRSVSFSAGHAWQGIILERQAEFDAHPEYRALVDGKRQGEQLCVSNPDLQALVVAYAINRFERDPSLESLSMEPSDGLGHCECPDCVALGSVSNAVFGLANQVAKAVGERFPGRWIALLAYSAHSDPPDFDLEPNVFVARTRGFVRSAMSWEELTEAWTARTKNLGYYDYYSVFLWDWDMPPGGRAADLGAVRDGIREYTRGGAISLDCESGNNWGLHGLGYYLASQLMWDPEADDVAIIDDFFSQAFGPAEAPMRSFYTRLYRPHLSYLNELAIGEALADLAKATRLAADRPDVLARLDELKLYVHFVSLYWDLQWRTPEWEDKKALALAVLTHTYRIRHTYMVHWLAMLRVWVDKWAAEYAAPNWSVTVYSETVAKAKAAASKPPPTGIDNLEADLLGLGDGDGDDGNAMETLIGDPPAPNEDPDLCPWVIEKPYTPAEIADLFAADLKRFPTSVVDYATFGRDLVAVKAPARPNGLAWPKREPHTVAWVQGASDFSFYAAAGQTVTLTLTPNYLKRDALREFRWTVYDAAGKVAAEDTFEMTPEPREVPFVAPATGIYRLNVFEGHLGWTMVTDPAAPMAITYSGEFRYRASLQQFRLWFYVPKGTKEVVFYCFAPSVVVDDGADRTSLNQGHHGVYRIPVQPGRDGQLWSLDKLSPRHVWFYTVPNVLNLDPDVILVPRELVERDGLQPFAP